MMLCQIQNIKEIVEMLCLKLLAPRKVLRDHKIKILEKKKSKILESETEILLWLVPW